VTVAATRMTDPLATARSQTLLLVNDDGTITLQGSEFLDEIRNFISGMSRVIPCELAGTANLLSLTPLQTAPRPKRYNSYDIYVARTILTSTGSVYATVVPEVGTLETISVYKDNGTAQADTGDVVADSLYLFVYADYLNGGAGGFVLK
jgi:hypothetical protein